MRFPFLVAVLALTGATGLAAATDVSEITDLRVEAPRLDELPLDVHLATVTGAAGRVAGSEATSPVLAKVAHVERRAHPAAAEAEDLGHLLFQLLPDGLLVLDLTGGATPADLTPLGDVMVRAPAARTVPLAPFSAPGPSLVAPAAGPAVESDPASEPVVVREPPATALLLTAAAPSPQTPERLPAALVVGSIAASLVGFLGSALYHRIRPNAALENDTRKVIFEAVCAHPGLGVHAIAKTAGVSYSTATYHLERLQGAGMIVMTPDGNKLCYYKNGGAFTETERRILPLIKNDEASRLLEAIIERPGTYRAELAERLGVTATTINWHLKRLREAGLVDETRQGRNAHLRARIGELRSHLDSLAQKVGESDPQVLARLRRYANAPAADLGMAGGA